MTVWFEAIWLFTAGKSGISAMYLHRVLPIGSYQTAWTMLSRLRQVMSSAESEPLRGTVEMDETFLGGPRHGKFGRGAAGKTLVAGALEILPDGWGRARLGVIPDASAASLKAFVRANIASGSTVITDAWRSYPSALAGYVHEPVNVAASGKPAHESLPAVHRLFALVKRSMEGTYQGSWSVEHLPQYLDEFVFRFNRRHSRSRGLVFMRLLQRAAASQRVTYRDLALVSKPKPVHPAGVHGARAWPGTLDIDSPPLPWRKNT
ncbi:transposase-like protein [Paeniglutamicibacter psychrophenolicus]|uniref:Transposase-like protein n=2 Tax=Paeniglutamicibacter psychrophenolicus TaxID=257454 RepID=A0ABS4WIW3_9MICC|nr:transposase-like protein [Paeniglutamicibacter psychrophenolicus]MBP2376147.1 transposase-like protein [Paeniglutamicibacter psychrophenolicus]